MNDTQLVDRVIRGAQQRNPVALDLIFDAHAPALGKPQMLQSIAQQLTPKDAAWFCGYMAGEINQRSDPPAGITLFSWRLINAGMQVFLDFSPYIGKRLVILNTPKFEQLPRAIQDEFHQLCHLNWQEDEQFRRDNAAIKREFSMR